MANILAKKQSTSKPVVIVNQNVEKYKHFDGMTLCDLKDLVDFTLSDYDNGGNTITSLVVETSKEKLVFNLSRGISDITEDELYTDETITSNVFRLRNKKAATDGEGVYSGAAYISYGKPGGITLNERASYLAATEKVGG